MLESNGVDLLRDGSDTMNWTVYICLDGCEALLESMEAGGVNYDMLYTT